MAVEIELKAWVDDPPALRAKLNTIAEYKTAYTKEDVYYRVNSSVTPKTFAMHDKVPISDVRIRKETLCDNQNNKSITVLVTYKIKEIKDKIEVNDEKEFAICSTQDDLLGAKEETADKRAAIFEEMLLRLGLKRSICKKKIGYLWKAGNINVEVSLIENLGTFLELEIIVPQDSGSEIILESRKQLLDFLSLCNITHDKIETRYYTEMLKTCKGKQGFSILILGAGIMQSKAIRIAKELGLYVIVADGNRDAEFIKDADEFVHIDLKEKDAIADFALKLKKENKGLCGIFTAGTDFSATVAYACQKAGLPSTSYESALNASDKSRMRQCFAAANVPSPKFKVFNKADFVKGSAFSASLDFAYPIVVKPVDNMGGRGCRKVCSETELQAAMLSSFEFSRSGRVIVEEFLEGDEYSIDAIVYKGEITICGIADRHIFFPPYFIEMGHTMPCALDEKSKQELVQVFEAGVKALGITTGAAKGDMKLTKKGAAVGEIAARLSGGYMSGWTFPYSSGVEVTKSAILIATGKSPDNLTPVKQNTSAERAFISIPGKISAIKFKKNAENIEYVVDLFFRVETGSCVFFPENNVSKCGNVISAAPCRIDAIDAAERAVRTVLFELEYPNIETENFLNTALGGSFPPDAFPVNGNILGQLELLPASSAQLCRDKKNQIGILSFNDFTESNIKDYVGRSVYETLDAIRKITNLTLPIKENAVPPFLGKEFWYSLIRGGYQGASYRVCNMLGGFS